MLLPHMSLHLLHLMQIPALMQWLLLLGEHLSPRTDCSPAAPQWCWWPKALSPQLVLQLLLGFLQHFPICGQPVPELASCALPGSHLPGSALEPAGHGGAFILLTAGTRGGWQQSESNPQSDTGDF